MNRFPGQLSLCSLFGFCLFVVVFFVFLISSGVRVVRKTIPVNFVEISRNRNIFWIVPGLSLWPPGNQILELWSPGISSGLQILVWPPINISSFHFWPLFLKEKFTELLSFICIYLRFLCKLEELLLWKKQWTQESNSILHIDLD